MAEQKKTSDFSEKQTEKLYTEAELAESVAQKTAELQKKLDESEKLAGMDASEKAGYLREQAEKSLAAREAAVAKRELMADAAERLKNAGLPSGLAACLDYSDRQACEASFITVTEAFSEAVRAAADFSRLMPVPKAADNGGRDAFLDGLFN